MQERLDPLPDGFYKGRPRRDARDGLMEGYTDLRNSLTQLDNFCKQKYGFFANTSCMPDYKSMDFLQTQVACQTTRVWIFCKHKLHARLQDGLAPR